MTTATELQNSQPKGAITSVTVTLEVKAEDLFPYETNDQYAINQFTQISDGKSTVFFGKPKQEFETEVNLNTQVDWIAKPNDPSGADKDYEVKITGYLFKAVSNSTNVLGPFYIPRNASGQVRGVVENKPEHLYKENYYAIIFEILWVSKGETHEFILDPKLKVNPKKDLPFPEPSRG